MKEQIQKGIATKVVIMASIINRQSVFTFDDILNEVKFKLGQTDNDSLKNNIREVLSIYLKNGLVSIQLNGYKSEIDLVRIN